MSEVKVKVKAKTILPLDMLATNKPSKAQLQEIAAREAEALLASQTPLEVYIAAKQMGDYIDAIAEAAKPAALAQALANLPEEKKTLTVGHIKVTVSGDTEKHIFDFAADEDWKSLNEEIKAAETALKELKARQKAKEVLLALEIEPLRTEPASPTLKITY